MELEYLKEFSVLAKTLSFSRTAERLFTTQSTISKHLRSLEAALGMPLFVRTNRHVELTEEGRDFLPYAERMLQLQYEYQTYFYNRRGGGTPYPVHRLDSGHGPVSDYRYSDSF